MTLHKSPGASAYAMLWTNLENILPLAKQLLKEVDYERHPIRLLQLAVFSNPREESQNASDQRE